MPEVNQHYEHEVADADDSSQSRTTASAEFFEAERQEEARKRFATYSLWAGLLSLLLLLIPNPFAPFAGAAAVLLGIHALLRIFLQPARQAGVFRAVLGIVMGLIAVLISLRS